MFFFLGSTSRNHKKDLHTSIRGGGQLKKITTKSPQSGLRNEEKSAYNSLSRPHPIGCCLCTQLPYLREGGGPAREVQFGGGRFQGEFRRRICLSKYQSFCFQRLNFLKPSKSIGMSISMRQYLDTSCCFLNKTSHRVFETKNIGPKAVEILPCDPWADAAMFGWSTNPSWLGSRNPWSHSSGTVQVKTKSVTGRKGGNPGGGGCFVCLFGSLFVVVSDVRIQSGQISIIPKPELRGFWWDSLTKPPFGVTSAEVAIICPDPMIFFDPWLTNPTPKVIRFVGGVGWTSAGKMPLWNVKKGYFFRWISFFDGAEHAELEVQNDWPHLLKDKGVSRNSGTPKSSILIGFSIINHTFWGTPIVGNTHIEVVCFLMCFSGGGSWKPSKSTPFKLV